MKTKEETNKEIQNIDDQITVLQDEKVSLLKEQEEINKVDLRQLKGFKTLLNLAKKQSKTRTVKLTVNIPVEVELWGTEEIGYFLMGYFDDLDSVPYIEENQIMQDIMKGKNIEDAVWENEKVKKQVKAIMDLDKQYIDSFKDFCKKHNLSANEMNDLTEILAEDC